MGDVWLWVDPPDQPAVGDEVILDGDDVPEDMPPGWTRGPGSRSWYRTVTQAGPQPWPGFTACMRKRP
jgi:hypothetical protein